MTGASRGVGRGIALGLGEAGATVYVAGRTVEEGTSAARLPGSVPTTGRVATMMGLDRSDSVNMARSSRPGA